ncbi:MAG TPA: polysaccharide deacetylase family protein [Micromonosporaceae bacterium]
MRRPGVPATALAVGALVAALLMGVRVAGTWQHRDIVAAHPSPTVTARPGGPAGSGRAGSRQDALGVQRVTGSADIALTFDDGPSPTWTPKVLDLLRANRVKATFCLVGAQVHKYPALVARIVREGHVLCNHSWIHDVKLGGRPAAAIRADLVRTNAEIRKAVPGAKIAFFRQPGGRWTPAVVTIVRALGMIPLGWDVDPRDWEKPPARTIQQRVLTGVRPGSIVLLHDGGGDRTQTLAACRSLLTQLRGRFHFVPMLP